MRKSRAASTSFFLLLAAATISALIPGCRRTAPPVERTMEDGVEVVINRARPVPPTPAAPALTLEPLLTIDTEDDATAALGITDVYLFDADDAGNVYIVVPPTGPRDCVHKLSPDGKLLASFARVGQGPNEVEYPSDVRALDNGEVWVLESPKNRILAFDADGRPLGERSPVKFESLVPLANGHSLVVRLDASDLSARHLPLTIELYDAEFRLVKELDRCAGYPNRKIFEKVPEPYIKGTGFAFLAAASRDRLFVGNSERGYEIRVFDLDGRLLRKIRKEHTPVPVTEEHRRAYLKDFLEFWPEYARKIDFPPHWHAFHGFFADGEGRLFVMTFEPGARPGEHVYDVFDRDGVLSARVDLAALHRTSETRGQLMAFARGDRLYTVREKPSGFKRLAVHRMIWK
jgi:hypothetical protein